MKFQGLRDVGDPVELGAAYSDAGADELVFLDIAATVESRATLVDLVRRDMGAELVPAVDSPAQWLAEHGWQTEFFRVPAIGEHYGRPLPAGVDLVASNATVLTAASR